jgi:hypothetical protein
MMRLAIVSAPCGWGWYGTPLRKKTRRLVVDPHLEDGTMAWIGGQVIGNALWMQREFRHLIFGVKLHGRRTAPAWIIVVIFIAIVSFPQSIGYDNRRIIVVIGNIAKRPIVKIVPFHKGTDVELFGKM